MIYSDSLQLTDLDRATLQAIAAENQNAPFHQVIAKAHRAIKNITPRHYILLGYMIGYVIGTEETYGEMINNNQPCRRVN